MKVLTFIIIIDRFEIVDGSSEESDKK